MHENQKLETGQQEHTTHTVHLWTSKSSKWAAYMGLFQTQLELCYWAGLLF